MDACLDRQCHVLAVAGVVLIVTVNTRSVRMTFERRSFWQGVDQYDQYGPPGVLYSTAEAQSYDWCLPRAPTQKSILARTFALQWLSGYTWHLYRHTHGSTVSVPIPCASHSSKRFRR